MYLEFIRFYQMVHVDLLYSILITMKRMRIRRILLIQMMNGMMK